MNERTQSTVQVAVRSVGELALVSALVFATGWAGVHLATAAHRWPVGPGRGGVIELRLAKSDRRGDATFEEGAGYVGWWHCRGDWAVEWKLAPKLAGRYQVEVRVASPEPATEGRLEVAVGDQVLASAVTNSGGPANWQKLNVGVVSLEAKLYPLVVRPGPGGMTNLNVRSVTLRPILDK